MKSLSELGEYDRRQRGFEFARIVKYYAAERGSVPNAALRAEQTRAPQKIRDVLKAAVGAGSTSIGSPSAWGDELVGYRPMVEGFFASLRGRSIFFRLLGDGAFSRVPMLTRLAFAVSNASGYIVGAGKPKPLSRFDLAADNLEPVRAIAQVVVSEELLRDTSSAAEAAFGRELRAAVADTTDAEFLSIVSTNIAPLNSTTDPDADIKTMLDDVSTTGAERLYFMMRPALANLMVSLRHTNGPRIFPEMTPSGGSIVGVPALVSTQVSDAAGSPGQPSLWLLDATGVAADAAEIEVRMSREAVVEMETAPAGDAVTAEGLGTTALVSLWQQNLIALLAEVRFAAYRYRSNAVAVLEGVAW